MRDAAPSNVGSAVRASSAPCARGASAALPAHAVRVRTKSRVAVRGMPGKLGAALRVGQIVRDRRRVRVALKAAASLVQQKALHDAYDLGRPLFLGGMTRIEQLES